MTSMNKLSLQSGEPIGGYDSSSERKNSESTQGSEKKPKSMFKVDAPAYIPPSMRQQAFIPQSTPNYGYKGNSYHSNLGSYGQQQRRASNLSHTGRNIYAAPYSGLEMDSADFLTASDKQAMFFNSGAMDYSLIENQLFGASKHMSAGIDFDKYDDIPVECSGTDIPEEMKSYDPQIDKNYHLHSSLLENIQRAKYLKPTPIQRFAIPITLKQRDVMACAQTGSGKTAAFLFPIIDHLLTNNEELDTNQRNREFSEPRALVLAPTRELASQIFEEAVRFTYKSNLHCVVVYGGANIQAQIAQLQWKNCDICVATPGRLLDLREREIVKFDKIQFLVLDEADRMLDMGFEPQIRKICQEFDLPGKENRTTSMFSATFPAEIQRLAGDFLKNYVFVTVGRVGGAAKNVTQSFTFVPQDNYLSKKEALMQIIYSSNQESLATSGQRGLKLIFVETKRKCDELCKDLRERYQIRSVAIHGDRSQNQREKALSLFTSKKVEVMVATDVASRGLDIPNVEHVINFDVPSDIDSYVHRIGRTGRAGNKGRATAIMSTGDVKIAKPMMKILSEAEQKVPEWMYTLANSDFAKAPKPQRFNMRPQSNSFGGRDFRSMGGFNHFRPANGSMMYAQNGGMNTQFQSYGAYQPMANGNPYGSVDVRQANGRRNGW